MSVFFDIKPKMDVAAAQLAAREAAAIFTRAGDDISRGLGTNLAKAFAVDTGAARREMQAMQAEMRRTADVEADSARRMVASMGQVEVAQKRLAEMTAKYGADSSKAMAANVGLANSHAVAARAQRDHADAMVATEGAAAGMAAKTAGAAGEVSRAGQVFNAVGIASVAGLGVAFVETTKKAGDFQQSQQRLVASAGETAQNLKTVSDGILNLAGQVGYSSQELSNGMYTVEKAGYRGADGVNVLRSSAQLAKAENADLGEVLNGLTTSMHDFGFSSDQSAVVASRMNTAVGLAKTTLQEFSGALHSVEPIAAAAGLKLEDVYGSLAQVTQSGTSADQAAQNMARSISQLMKPTQQMRDEMGQLGVDARDVQAHLGDRGFAGTVQMLSDRIRSQMNPAGQVVIDTMFKSQQATDAATQIFNNLPPAAKSVAEAIKDGSLSYKDFRKSRGGLDVEQANEIGQWVNLNNKVTGFSAALKTGQGDIQTYEQALALMTGGQDSLRTVLQLVGENAGATNDKIKAVRDTTAEADGTVKGFNETQQTLNAKMADAKAAFGAAAIELGNAFIPIMTDVANVAKDVGDAMAKHPGIVHAAIDAVGALAAAWGAFKAVSIAQTVLAPITAGLATMAEAEGIAATAAGGLTTALSGALAVLGPLGAGLAAAQFIGKPADKFIADKVPGGAAVENAADPVGWGQSIADHLGARQSREFFKNLFSGHAGGGPLNAPGPKGRDSALFWGAAGEHVLTASDVDAMGGHAGVHSFRNALHRAGGGALGNVNTTGMQVDTIAVTQAVEQMFPGTTIGGYRAPDGFNEHSSGEAADIMVGANKSLGDSVASWALANAGQFGIEYVLWQQRQWNPNGTSSPMENRGSPTQNHMDHVHIRTAGGGFPAGGLGGPQGTGSMPAGTSSTPSAAASQGFSVGGMGSGGFGGRSGGMGSGGGYYTQDPQKVAAAQERLTHLDEEIRIAEERKTNLKATASQAEKDRLDEEIRHLHAERDQAQGRLEKAQQGDFHQGRSGGLSGGGPGGFGAPLPANFGLGKGLAGVAEWLVTWLGDMAVAPWEAQMAAQAGMGGDGSGMDAGGYSPSMPGAGGGGGYANLGSAFGSAPISDVGAPSPSPDGGGPSDSGPSGGGTPAAPLGAGAQATPFKLSGGQAFDPTQFGAAPGTRASGIHTQNDYRLFQAGVLDANGNPIPHGPVSGQIGDLLNGGGRGQFPTGPASAGGAFVPSLLMPGHDFGPGLLGGPPSSPGTPQRGVTAPTQPGRFGPPSGAPMTLFPSYHSTGGPSGTDTVPAWLSPGEFVVNSSAAKKFGPQLAFMNAQHFSGGGATDTGSAAPAPKPPPPKPPPKPDPKQDPKATPGGPKTPQGEHPTKEAADNQPKPGGGGVGSTGTPSKGLGISGGVIGAAEGAASAGADMFGAGGATQIASQLANRTIAYAGQMAGIGVQGVLSSIFPTDSPLSDFGNTLPGKLLSGIAGAKPAAPQSAGATKPPLQRQDDAGGKPQGESPSGMQIHSMTVQANNADQFRYSMERQHQQYQMDANQYAGRK